VAPENRKREQNPTLDCKTVFEAAPEAILPMVADAHRRNRVARAAVAAGDTLATKQDAVERRAWRCRGRRA
jgi:hypothetical protein